MKRRSFLKGLVGAPAVAVCAQARCAYCGGYGVLGQCEACGAPNEPIEQAKPVNPGSGVSYNMIDVTTFGDTEARYIVGIRSTKGV